MTKTEELLQSALYQIVRENPFIGGFLQELTFKFNNQIPTAAIGYNKQTQKYELLFNLTYFNKLGKEARMAILMHEVLHFLHKHLFRWSLIDVKEEDRMLWNIAADMAINQYINGLPEGGIDVKNFKTDTGPFPNYQTMETYHELLSKNRKGNETKGKPQKDKNGNEMKDQNGQPVMGTGNEGPNKEELDKFTPMDEHIWDNLTDEEKERMAREAEKLIKRTIEKTAYSHSSVPGFVEDFLKELDSFLRKLNYKAILRAAIKKTVMSQDREHSWKRPNKRYGEFAPGSSLSRTPQINMYVDTSGSISHQELNEFLNVIDGFLKAGNKQCKLVLWHTDVYYNKKYKMKGRIKKDEIQAGGTDPNPTLELIKKTKPDLSIILTDMFFDRPSIKVDTEVIWIVSKQGNKERIVQKEHKVIPLEGIK